MLSADAHDTCAMQVLHYGSQLISGQWYDHTSLQSLLSVRRFPSSVIPIGALRPCLSSRREYFRWMITVVTYCRTVTAQFFMCRCMHVSQESPIARVVNRLLFVCYPILYICIIAYKFPVP